MGCMRKLLVPVDTKPPASPSKVFREDAPLPRSALAALDPEAEAKLPDGAHPDDERFVSVEVG